MDGGLALVDHTEMAEPRIKRYALVPQAGEDGMRRFSLARVATGSVPDAGRLERMEEIAALESRDHAPREDGKA